MFVILSQLIDQSEELNQYLKTILDQTITCMVTKKL